MRIHVRYFAIVRERLGSSEERIELPEGATVATALDVLAGLHEPVRELRALLQVAVNREHAPAKRALAEGDELALIPPVAGGADDRPPRLARMVADRAPSLEQVVAAVAGPEMGGVVTFVGLVRETSTDGRRVTRLEYEAYAEMADRVLAELCDELEAEQPGTRVAVEHREGVLEIGEVAVAMAAAAPHRAEAFRACQALIDRLKERAPIWKKETGPDGATWVGSGG